jgi:L-lactate dehydrogenase (cytochrome)
MTVITHIADLQALAKKRVPKMFYDYADSGSWTESTYRANEDDFQKIKLRQRVAVNMEGRDTATTMIGQAAAMPTSLDTLYDLVYSLRARYRRNANWVANKMSLS